MGKRSRHSAGSTHTHWQRWWRTGVVSSLLASALLLGSAGLSSLDLGLGGSAQAHGLASNADKPNHFDPHSQANSVHSPKQQPMDKVTDHLYIPKFIRDQQAKKKTQTTQQAISPMSVKPIVKNIQMPMAPGSLALKAGQPTTFKGSDNRLEISVSADAVTTADIASGGGALSLKITQIAPASGSNTGGSGRVSLGGYLVQVVDNKGVLASQGLRKPATLKIHFGSRDSALDLSHAYAIFNPSLPEGVTLASVPGMPSGEQAAIHGVVTPVPATRSNSQFGSYGKQRLTLDAANHTLAVPLTLSSPSTSMSFDTDSAVAGFGTPDPFNTDLNAAAITGSYPIDIPPGPGGLTPPVSLAYNSDAVNSQHNLQAAASWVGLGFSLGLGSISWAEHNVNANCPSGQSGCTGALWEDNWYLNDSFGTSAELIPPDINVGTYYEDGTNPITPSPVTWHTTPETRAKVISFTAPFDLPYTSGTHARPPCFRVFLANGIMEEFGCTSRLDWLLSSSERRERWAVLSDQLVSRSHY